MSNTTKQNKDLLRRAIRAYNDRDRESFAQYHSADVVLHGRTENIRGRDEVITHQLAFLDSFSDSTISIDEMVAEGDTVALRYRTSGTHDGTFGDVPPTGNSVEMELLAMVRIREGLIAEKWIQADIQGLLDQLEVTTPAGASRPGLPE